MTTSVTLIINADGHSEEFPHFTGYIPHVGDSVVYYSKVHDGCQYSGVVKHIHHRIEFQHQNDLSFGTQQTIYISISEKKGHQ